MLKQLTEIRKLYHNGKHPWVVDILAIPLVSNGYVMPDGTAGDAKKGWGYYDTRKAAEKAETLYLAKNAGEHNGIETSAGDGKIRTFESGATRDTVEGKLDYVKALCPLVLRRYVQYLAKHRLQPDGSMRDFDNWKQGIPRETYHSSKGRHFFADWLLEEGYDVSDNHGPVDEEEALCGELFNTMGKLREILRAKLPKKE